MAPTRAITAMAVLKKQIQMVFASGITAVRQRANDRSGQMMNLSSVRTIHWKKTLRFRLPAAIADPPDLTIDTGY